MLWNFSAIDLHFLSGLAICYKVFRGFDDIRAVFHVVGFCCSWGSRFLTILYVMLHNDPIFSNISNIISSIKILRSLAKTTKNQQKFPRYYVAVKNKFQVIIQYWNWPSKLHRRGSRFSDCSTHCLCWKERFQAILVLSDDTDFAIYNLAYFHVYKTMNVNKIWVKFGILKPDTYTSSPVGRDLRNKNITSTV